MSSLIQPIQKDIESRDGSRLLTRSVFVSSSLYLAYIGFTCPCFFGLYRCHLTSLYVAIVVLLMLLVYHNGPRVTSY